MPRSSPGMTGAFCDARPSNASRTRQPQKFLTAKQLQTHVRDLAARCARAVHLSLAPVEGVGNAGCPLHPQPRVRSVESTRVFTTVAPEHPAFPHAMVLTVSFVLSPVTGLVCHRRLRIKVLSKPGWADLNSANLTPASGRQDHTILPSAAIVSRQRAL